MTATEHTMWNRLMLEERIPARLTRIYRTLGQNHQEFEPWRLVLTTDLVESVGRNCSELAETIGKDRLSAAAWIARNLLELCVWVRYCGVSRETAWRFYEDAARDLDGLIRDGLGKLSDIMVLYLSETTAAQRIKDFLEMTEIDARYLKVADAAKTESVDLGEIFGPVNQILSKFCHPTALLVAGMPHQVETSRGLQAQFTFLGVANALYSIHSVEAQLGLPEP
jgi:hypothetical protein